MERYRGTGEGVGHRARKMKSTAHIWSVTRGCTRWGVFERTVVVVTPCAGRRVTVFAIGMTVGAIKFAVRFVKQKAGHRMGEIPLIPARMARTTLIVQASNDLSSGMAGTAIQMRMKSVERPAGFGVRKGRFFF